MANASLTAPQLHPGVAEPKAHPVDDYIVDVGDLPEKNFPQLVDYGRYYTPPGLCYTWNALIKKLTLISENLTSQIYRRELGHSMYA